MGHVNTMTLFAPRTRWSFRAWLRLFRFWTARTSVHHLEIYRFLAQR
jgi:hypothetical protein